MITNTYIFPQKPSKNWKVHVSQKSYVKRNYVNWNVKSNFVRRKKINRKIEYLIHFFFQAGIARLVAKHVYTAAYPLHEGDLDHEAEEGKREEDLSGGKMLNERKVCD